MYGPKFWALRAGDTPVVRLNLITSAIDEAFRHHALSLEP